jgi:hypothetical protein
MTNYTAREVEQAIEGHDYFDGWGEIKWSNEGDVALEIPLNGETVPVTKVASFGGEGQGDEIWVVVQVGTQLFRKDGYYASHYGSDWDGDFEEVAAREKVVTVYEAK